VNLGSDDNDYDFEVAENDEALGELNSWNEMVQTYNWNENHVFIGFGVSKKWLLVVLKKNSKIYICCLFKRRKFTSEILTDKNIRLLQLRLTYNICKKPKIIDVLNFLCVNSCAKIGFYNDLLCKL